MSAAAPSGGLCGDKYLQSSLRSFFRGCVYFAYLAAVSTVGFGVLIFDPFVLFYDRLPFAVPLSLAQLHGVDVGKRHAFPVCGLFVGGLLVLSIKTAFCEAGIYENLW